MVEGARLESVYTGNRIVGSNPTFTATQSRSAVEACISAKLAGFSVIFEPRPISSSNRSPAPAVSHWPTRAVMDASTPDVWAPLLRGAHRETPARPDEMAGISIRILLEIVLMLGLGFPEISQGRDLGHDPAGPQP